MQYRLQRSTPLVAAHDRTASKESLILEILRVNSFTSSHQRALKHLLLTRHEQHNGEARP